MSVYATPIAEPSESRATSFAMLGTAARSLRAHSATSESVLALCLPPLSSLLKMVQGKELRALWGDLFSGRCSKVATGSNRRWAQGGSTLPSLAAFSSVAAQCTQLTQPSSSMPAATWSLANSSTTSRRQLSSSAVAAARDSSPGGGGGASQGDDLSGGANILPVDIGLARVDGCGGLAGLVGSLIHLQRLLFCGAPSPRPTIRMQHT